MSLDFWDTYWGFVAFVFGAIVGSFLNVCIWRLPRGESPITPASRCPNCSRRLRFFPDMVPILSQLWYRSRCRQCGERFSWRYLWVEALTGLVFVGVYVRYAMFAPSGFTEGDATVSALAGMIFAAALIAVFFIDLEHYHIPDVVVLVAFLAAVGKDFYLIARDHRPLWMELPGTSWSLPLPLSILGALIAFWAMWQLAAVASAALGKEAMGAGDSLLLGAMGAFLIPWPLVPLSFIFAVGLGTVGGLVGIWLAGRAEQPAGETSDALPDPPASSSVSGSRGAMELPTSQDSEEEIPLLPPSSRWGRILTVAGTWIAVLGLWGSAVLAERQPAVGIACAAGAVIAAAALVGFGTRIWVRGDAEWLPAMDALFDEGEPGPRFVPFGPYLVAGTFLAMFAGRWVLNWYLGTHLGLDASALNAMPWD